MKNAQEIDFLKARQGEDLTQTKLFRYLKVGSLVSLVFYCLFLAALFSYWLYLQKSSQKISQQYSLQKQKISSLQEVESQHLLFKQRLASLAKLFLSQKSDYPQIFSTLDEMTLDGISFSKIEVNKDNQFLFSGEAGNASVLSIFLEKFYSFYGQGKEAEIILSSLNRGKNGHYTFSLSVRKYEKS
jgi:Tfp pilus assembly protein PilN